jgi:hypothetical protein
VLPAADHTDQPTARKPHGADAVTLDEANVISSIGRLEAGEISLKEGITEIKRELSEMRREVRDDVSAIRTDLAARGKMNWPLLCMAAGVMLSSLGIVERFMVTPLEKTCVNLQSQIIDSNKHIDALEHDYAEMKSNLSMLIERTRISTVPQKVFGEIQ